MTDPNQSLEEALFELAAQKPAGAERAAFLDGVCRDQPALRARLNLLLEGFDGGPGFLKQAPVRPPLAAVPAVEPPAPQIGRYKLLEKIGEGGFGEVWMAEQREPVKRRVALKLIKLGMDSRQIVARFEAERQALAMMDHANIAKIFDANVTETGRPYFVMELVRGIKITEYCDQNQLTTQERLGLFIKVCQAIQHAHQKGIIHRDIKPSNILVTVNDGVPVPKVIDFGIAKATQGELTDKTVFTQFQQFIGTPAYISPEQAEMSSLDIDTRADIYSLGVLLYELLVGQTPFDAKEMMKGGLDALRQIIREREPQRPSTKLNTLPGDARTTAGKRRQTDAGKLAHQLQGDLDWIVLKCLEKDRTRRYDTANGLAADLQRHLANEPVVARPPSMAYKIQKAWQRNKLAFSAAAILALALLVGSTVSTWQAVRATRATRAETEQRLAAQKAEALAVNAQALAVANEKEAKAHQQRAELSEASTADLLYGANLNLAQVSFEKGNFSMTQRLLDQTRSHKDRGFEWYYWQREMHRATRILRGHAGRVDRVAFSPDGRRILTQGEDGVVIIRDAASGEEQLRVTAGSFLQFSPDGGRLLCSDKGGLQIRSASTGDELTSTDLVRFGTFTPDGKQFATVRGERAVFRDAVTGKELSSFKAFSHYTQWHENPIAFSPDGRWMLNGRPRPQGGGAALHDAVTGEVVKIIGKGESLMTAVFSPDGRRIVTSTGWGSQPTIWDIDQPDRPLARLYEGGGTVANLRFSADGRRLLTATGATATLWDAETFQILGRFEGPTGGIKDLAFSPDGQWVATASEDGAARIWAADAFSGPRVLKDPKIRVGAFSPDGRYLATGGEGFAVIWETTTFKPLHRLKVHHPVPGRAPRLIPDFVLSVSFSPDGRRLVVSSDTFAAFVFDVESGRPLHTLDHTAAEPIRPEVISAVFSPDGKQIVTVNHLTVRTWDAESGQLLAARTHKRKTAHHRMPPVGFTPDGRLYSASNEELTFWDPVTREEVFRMPIEKAWSHTDPHPAIAFSPDGKHFALSCKEWQGAIQLHEAASGRLLSRMQGHGEFVRSLEFSPDGARLLSGSLDASVKIWDLSSGREVLSLKAPGYLEVARFRPDGRMIFVSGWPSQGFLWEAATPDQVTAWLAEEAAGAEQWAAMTEEFRPRQSAAWTSDEGEKARRAAFTKATEEKLARQGDPALLGKLPGAIRQWLTFYPPMTWHKPEISLDDEQIQNEARLRPRAQESVSVGGSDRIWTPLQLEDYRLDFLTSPLAGHAETAAYAVSYILSERDQTGLVLKVGSDYHAKIYLNQREIYRRVNPATGEPDRDTVAGVELKAGLNVLVFKVVRGAWGHPWSGSVRFTNADASPPQGLTVTLDPDAAP